MAKTGPQQYPGASLRYDYSERYPGSPMESNVICWHTTEGTSVPTYGGGASAPNFTVAPDIRNKRSQWYQHFDFDESSRALVNLGGGVETNTLNVCQVEIVGTCDPRYDTSWGTRRAGVDYLFVPNAPGWFLDDLAEFAAWANKNHGVRLQSGLRFRPYPASYGTRAQNGVRMTGDQWMNFYGHCGHQHVPENLHGDPGDLDIERVLARAKEIVGGGGATAPSKPKPTAPRYEPFPGVAFFKMGRRSPIVKAMRKRLIAEGCGRYQSNRDQDVIGTGDVASYEAWQRKCGFKGKDATWPPGKTTWDRLKVPNV